jgi:hypothetical protein
MEARQVSRGMAILTSVKAQRDAIETAAALLTDEGANGRYAGREPSPATAMSWRS